MRPINALGANKRRDESFTHKPKTKLKLVAAAEPEPEPEPVPAPAPEPAQERAHRTQTPWAWEGEPAFENEEVPTHVGLVDDHDHAPSRMPIALIWQVAKDAVQDMPHSTNTVEKYDRVAHVYCGLALNKPGRHATLRYVHTHMMERLSRIWRRRERVRYEGLVYLASTILHDLERQIMALFERGRDLANERLHGRRVRQCRMTTGRRRNCFFTYELHGENDIAYILTLQNRRCHNRQHQRSRLQPRHRVRRSKDLGRLRQHDF